MLEIPNQPTRTLRRAIAGLAMLVAALASIACERSAPAVPRAQPAIVDTTRTIAQGDSALRFPILPDTAKTPGATLDVTAADICVPGYSKKVRNVPVAVKRQVYALYGVRTHEPGEYEVDHLISLEIGGSNSIKNLWPQSFRTHPWNAHVKDALENELHRRVCAGTMELAKAQQVIAHDWVIGYRNYVHPTPPRLKPRASTPTRNSERQRARPQPRPEAPVP
jgi:hypothetical protein